MYCNSQKNKKTKILLTKEKKSIIKNNGKIYISSFISENRCAYSLHYMLVHIAQLSETRIKLQSKVRDCVCIHRMCIKNITSICFCV